MDNLFFNMVELSEGDKPVWMDGMAPGKFTDMHGKNVEIKPDDFQDYVKNTKAALESTKDENGEIAGLPVDAIGHRHEEAAGWIKDVSLSDDKKIVRFNVEWNELGKKSIKEKLLRYFSPAIDLGEKVIMGGSLTNYPATRTKKHEMLLKPVALSMSLYSLEEESLDARIEKIRSAFTKQFNAPGIMWEKYPIEIFEEYLICRSDEKTYRVNYVENEDGSITFDAMGMWVEVKRSWVVAALEQIKRVLSGFKDEPGNISTMEVDMEFDLEKATPEQKAALLSQARESVLEEIKTTPPAELASLIEARTNEGIQTALAVEKRKAHVAEFAARVVGGTPEAPKGLPVTKEQLESLLLSLPEEKQAELEAILGSIMEKGIVKFDELGHAKITNGNRELPSEMKGYLQKWIDEGNKPEAWFTANAAELGDMSEYNLAEFKEK